MIIDIHSHNAESGDSIINMIYPDFTPIKGRWCSLGIHPWYLPENHTNWLKFREMAECDDVVAIGECGIDKSHGPDAGIQAEFFCRQAEIADSLGKPLIIHCVKAYEEILRFKRILRPRNRWIIHGFRGNADVARMMLGKGVMLSFGERFNPQALLAVPTDMMFAETDTSALPIASIVENMARAMAQPAERLVRILADNVLRTF